jgi:hypothetical protein
MNFGGHKFYSICMDGKWMAAGWFSRVSEATAPAIRMPTLPPAQPTSPILNQLLALSTKPGTVLVTARTSRRMDVIHGLLSIGFLGDACDSPHVRTNRG